MKLGTTEAAAGLSQPKSKARTPHEEFRFLEYIFDKLENLEATVERLKIVEVHTLLVEILNHDTALEDINSARINFLEKLCADPDMAARFELLLNVKSANTTASQYLKELRDFVYLYARRKYSALAIFGIPFFDASVFQGVYAKLFCPQLVSVQIENSSIAVNLCVGLFGVGLVGQKISLQARIRTQKEYDDSHPVPKIVEMFQPAWVKSLPSDRFIDDQINTQISFNRNFVAEDPTDLELGLFLPSGECLDRIFLPLEAITEVSANKDLEPPHSTIKDISVRLENAEVVITYKLHLTQTSGGGLYLVIDLLDRYGEVLPEKRSLWPKRASFDSAHEQTSLQKLTFKRFIPAAKGTDIEFIGELKIPRHKLGVGLFRARTFFASFLIFDAAEVKLDHIEQKLTLRDGSIFSRFGF